jgi:hypothetical protein
MTFGVHKPQVQVLAEFSISRCRNRSINIFLIGILNLVLANSKTPKCALMKNRKLADLLIILNNLGAQTLQTFRGDLSDSHQRVELLLCVFLIVPLTGNPDPDTSRYTPDTAAPDVLVKLHIDPDIRGAHCLLCKFSDLLDGVGCLLLEGAAFQYDELSVTNCHFE